ncbi:hypothetical protein SAMN05421505_12816 [Sinosporangium album]|uniref:DUF5753 domain-containing protein n=2 Tax=Sinosporangium album TaxID=504805 RepID=A0A1G8GMM5_9ACTN|nr:hypothetical protein SAMN05421505_12816 [Sinosporangium album]
MMLNLYGVDSERHDVLMTLARDARQRGWWQAYSGAIPQWFEVYVGLEEEASKICSWENEQIDGRLQTEDYMRALFQSEMIVPSDEEIDRRVAVRLKRQEKLLAADAPELWVVVGEGALRRMVGGVETMRGQINKLIQAPRINNIMLQVLPFSAGAHPAMHGAFHLLGFAGDPDVVYVEYRQGSLYLEQAPDVDAYVKLFDHLRARALSPDDSRVLLARVMDEIS